MKVIDAPALKKRCRGREIRWFSCLKTGNKNLGVYKGALYENMVGEALVKQGYKLFYYKKENSTLEEDYFIRSASSLIPVEVKAKSGRAKSMKTLIASEHYPDIRFGIKLSNNNIGHEDCIYTFPLFCAFLLKRFIAGFQAAEEAESLSNGGNAGNNSAE